MVGCQLSDTCGFSDVNVKYQVNAGSWQESKFYELYPTHFNASLGSFNLGDQVNYYIEAVDNSSAHNTFTSDTFNFTITSNDYFDEFEKDNGFAYCNEIFLDVNQSRRIYPIGDIDVVKFELVNPENLTFQTFGDLGGWTFLRLYDSNFTLIGYDEANGTDGYSRLDITLPDDTYYVTITEHDNDDVLDNYILSV